jgi:hypothetical protein
MSTVTIRLFNHVGDEVAVYNDAEITSYPSSERALSFKTTKKTGDKVTNTSITTTLPSLIESSYTGSGEILI